jgi:hypothetical protein
MSLFAPSQTTTTTNPANPFGGSLNQQNQNAQQSAFGTASLFNQSQVQQQQQQAQQPNMAASFMIASQNQQRSGLWEPGRESPSMLRKGHHAIRELHTDFFRPEAH